MSRGRVRATAFRDHLASGFLGLHRRERAEEPGPPDLDLMHAGFRDAEIPIGHLTPFAGTPKASA
jgi:hypothetical protein